MGILLSTIVEGLALVASLAATGEFATGEPLDRYGGRSHPSAIEQLRVIGAETGRQALPAAADGARFYALHRDYGLTPDVHAGPASPPTELRQPTAPEVSVPDPAPPSAPPSTPSSTADRPAGQPSDPRGGR